MRLTLMSVIASLTIIAGASTSFAQAGDEARARELVERALRGRISQYHNSALKEVGEFFLRSPTAALTALDSELSVLGDLSETTNRARAIGIIDLLAAIPDPRAIDRLDALYVRALTEGGPEGASAVRLRIVGRIANNPVRHDSDLLHAYPQRAADALKKWLGTESETNTLRTGLWILASNAAEIDPAVLECLRSKVGEPEVALALRTWRLEQIPSPGLRFDTALAWIDELLTSAEGAAPGVGIDSSSGPISTGLFRALRAGATSADHTAALRVRITRAKAIEARLEERVEGAPEPQRYGISTALREAGHLANLLVNALDKAGVALTPEEQARMKRLRGE